MWCVSGNCPRSSRKSNVETDVVIGTGAKYDVTTDHRFAAELAIATDHDTALDWDRAADHVGAADHGRRQ